MSENKKQKLDHIKVTISAFCKISSAIDDINELHGEKVYKTIVKKELNNFIDKYELLTKDIYNIIYEDNSKYMESVISEYNSYQEKVSKLFKDEISPIELKMILINIKLKSAGIDFALVTHQIDKNTHILGEIVGVYISRLLSNGFWNNFTKLNENLNKLVIKDIELSGKNFYINKN